MQQSLSVLQRPGKIILYLLFTILAIITALLCILDRLYHSWIWSFLSGIIFLYCVQASATITSIVAICSCVCSIDWCFPCSKFKALKRKYKYGPNCSGTGSNPRTSTTVVTFLCHQRNGSSSTVNSTPVHHPKSTTVSSVNYSAHKTSISDNVEEEECATATISNSKDTRTTEEILINEDLTRPATSYNNPCYLLAVSTTDENGIPTIILENKEGESVTQV